MRVSVLATTLASGGFLVWMVSLGNGAHGIYADDGRAPRMIATGAPVAGAARGMRVCPNDSTIGLKTCSGPRRPV